MNFTYLIFFFSVAELSIFKPNNKYILQHSVRSLK